ncbi:MAG: DUF1993 domain-containing protein [Labilithrix sp.]|nr:DUF1993 domain-containing protein [Labilithrix sp.]
MSLYPHTVPQFDKTLQNLERWIDKTIAHAKAHGFEANDLLTARLAPTQFTLVRQIQSVCDNAKLATARLSGKEAPSHPDTEKTWDEIRARIRSVREWLGQLAPADFEGAETRAITLPWAKEKTLSGRDYAIEFAVPNFYFHVTTAYSILRHNGVELGKIDFIGSLPFRDA